MGTRRWRQAGGASLHFRVPPDESVVFILGPRDAVADAVTVLTTPGLVVESLHVAGAFGHLVGGGQRAEEFAAMDGAGTGWYSSLHAVSGALLAAAPRVEAETGARVWMQHSRDRILVFGSPSVVRAGIEALRQRVTPAHVIRIMDAFGHLLGSPGISCEGDIVRAVLGRGRERVHAIKRTTGVRVSLTAGTIVLWGPGAEATAVCVELVSNPLWAKAMGK